MISALALVVLFTALAVQFDRLRPGNKQKRLRLVFIAAVFLVSAYFVYLVAAQYSMWSRDGSLGKYLVPPYKGIGYVVQYCFIRFGVYYAISLASALVFLFSAQKLNAKFGKRFFEPEEPYLGALAVFLLGNPAWRWAWIWYIGAMLVIATLVTSYHFLITKENRRFSLYRLWLPAALLVIIINELVDLLTS